MSTLSHHLCTPKIYAHYICNSCHVSLPFLAALHPCSRIEIIVPKHILYSKILKCLFFVWCLFSLNSDSCDQLSLAELLLILYPKVPFHIHSHIYVFTLYTFHNADNGKAMVSLHADENRFVSNIGVRRLRTTRGVGVQRTLYSYDFIIISSTFSLFSRALVFIVLSLLLNILHSPPFSRCFNNRVFSELRNLRNHSQQNAFLH